MVHFQNVGHVQTESMQKKMTMRIPIPDPICHSAIDTSGMLLIKEKKKKKAYLLSISSATQTHAEMQPVICTLMLTSPALEAWMRVAFFFFQACDHIICNVINFECTGIFLTPALTGHAPSTDCMIFSKSQDSFSKAVQPNSHIHLRIHSQQAKPKTLSARDKHAICKWAWAEFCNALWEPQLASFYSYESLLQPQSKKKKMNMYINLYITTFKIRK